MTEHWFEFGLLLMHLRRQQRVTQALGFLPATWETQMDFLVPDFGLAQPQTDHCYHLRGEVVEGRFLSSVSVSSSFYVILPFK